VTAFVEALINLRYPLVLPEDRVVFHAMRPTWEAERLSDMFPRVEECMTIFDIGAESGDFTALYRSWVGPDGAVIPVEPSVPYWPSIRQTYEANSFAPPPLSFAGFASSITDLHPPDAPGDYEWIVRDGWNAWSVGQVMPDFGFRHLCQETAYTPQITLTDLALEAGMPQVIVLDIEGAEYDAMVGMAGLVELAGNERPLVYISVHPPTMLEWYHRTVPELQELMASYGYDGVYLGTHGGEDFWRYQG
jgi:FkbM family methyltransferase